MRHLLVLYTIIRLSLTSCVKVCTISRFESTNIANLKLVKGPEFASESVGTISRLIRTLLSKTIYGASIAILETFSRRNNGNSIMMPIQDELGRCTFGKFKVGTVVVVLVNITKGSLHFLKDGQDL